MIVRITHDNGDADETVEAVAYTGARTDHVELRGLAKALRAARFTVESNAIMKRRVARCSFVADRAGLGHADWTRLVVMVTNGPDA